MNAYDDLHVDNFELFENSVLYNGDTTMIKVNSINTRIDYNIGINWTIKLISNIIKNLLTHIGQKIKF